MSGGRLEAAISVDLGGFRLDVELTVEGGEGVAVVGPNGAGKTTLIRALAGLVPLSAGRIVLGGEVLADVDAGVHVPIEQRRIGTVFQDRLLFDHLTALDNVAFGLRCRRASAREARASASMWLHRMGLEARAHARPRDLSGGEAQRVALARALAIDPRLLLLDEPFAALDARTRGETRVQMARHLDSFAGPRLLVTHDPVDALALASTVVVVEGGQVTQSGAAADLAARPRSAWVADLVGTNLYRGHMQDGVMTMSERPAVSMRVASDLGGAVLATMHPRTISLHRSRPEGSARNVWPGVVVAVEPVGDRVRVRVEGEVPLVAEVTPAAVAELGLIRDAAVWASVKATEIEAYAV